MSFLAFILSFNKNKSFHNGSYFSETVKSCKNTDIKHYKEQNDNAKIISGRISVVKVLKLEQKLKEQLEAYCCNIA